MEIILHKGQERGSADFGWFKAKYSFSFGQWYDPSKVGFGALRVFNDSIIMPQKGFPEHPHKNMEVITVQLEGRLNHTDISGTRLIQKGDVQVITAGSGVTHSDLNIGSEEAKQFQIWIFPDQPNTQPVSNLAHFSEKDRVNRWQPLVSPHGDLNTELHLQQHAWLHRGVFDQGKVNYQFKIPINHGVYIFVVNGSVALGDFIAQTRDAIGVSGTDNIEFECLTKSDVLMIEIPMGEY